MAETIFFGGLIVGGLLGLWHKFKRKPIAAKYFSQSSEWHHNEQRKKKKQW